MSFLNWLKMRLFGSRIKNVDLAKANLCTVIYVDFKAKQVIRKAG